MKVIKPSNLPTKAPVSFTIATGLLLDRISCPPWVWGAWGAVMILIWIMALFMINKDEYIDVFKN